MNKPKYKDEPRVEKCVMCDGYGSITDNQDEYCEECDGYGRVTVRQLREYLTPPAFDDWKSIRELREIDD